jgi:hypothetical protein
VSSSVLDLLVNWLEDSVYRTVVSSAVMRMSSVSAAAAPQPCPPLGEARSYMTLHLRTTSQAFITTLVSSIRGTSMTGQKMLLDQISERWSGPVSRVTLVSFDDGCSAEELWAGAYTSCVASDTGTEGRSWQSNSASASLNNR